MSIQVQQYPVIFVDRRYEKLFLGFIEQNQHNQTGVVNQGTYQTGLYSEAISGVTRNGECPRTIIYNATHLTVCSRGQLQSKQEELMC